MAPTADPSSEQLTDRLTAAAAATGAGDAAATWVPRFSPAYLDGVELEELVADVLTLHRLDSPPEASPDRSSNGPSETPADLAVRFTWMDVTAPGGHDHSLSDDSSTVVMSAYHRGGPMELSRSVPILESLGLWVVDGQHWAVDGWVLHRLGLRAMDDVAPPESASEVRWPEAVEALWAGRATADRLNRLVTVSGLGWHDVDLLRAYVHYRRQVDKRYSFGEVADVLVSSPEVATGLVDLFAHRFDPDRADADRAAALLDELGRRCDACARLTDDRILRGLVGTVDATVRTTRFLEPDRPPDGRPLGVKLDPARVPDIPDPVPAHETWVHGRLPGGGSVRGVHLRAGTVARGGLRWSDRRGDLRTEVLDLMRTQVLKNAPIVPTGAKGGFVVDGAAVSDGYDAFVGALLDLTDDRDGERVIPVPGRLDGDDTYLVVAADRGTGTFSDRANALAEARGYWLGDAFASGGSNGYDHKALGVTARGAFEAARHHLIGLGSDPIEHDVTVVGIGDLAGDVFGNFMLCSPHLRLVAAFDHRHVFVDPDPDTERAFEERKRVAALERSSWADYDLVALSDGGFVEPRTAKSVTLGREARQALRIEAEEVTPAELITAILRAPVDVLFAGGVGTFVRAEAEDDRSIDDRANVELRVLAEDIRARVAVEGANLAFTQRARIAYARHGGRINRDAIDNVAGVDTSDHEVNLKILLDLAVTAGDLDPAERNELLQEQTGAVVGHVLDRTRSQCERLTRSELASARQPSWFERVLAELVADGVLDPDVEQLPDDDELAARRSVGAGLTRPELSVMLAGVKRWLAAELLASPLPDQPACRRYLFDAFPDAVSERFDHLLDRHPLRRELVVSGITNEIVDRLGLTFVHRIAHDTGSEPAEVVGAALVAEGVANASVWWERLAAAPSGPFVDPDGIDATFLVIDLCDQLTRSELDRTVPDAARDETSAGAPHEQPDRLPDIAARIAEDRPVAEEMADVLRRRGSREQARRQSARVADLTDLGWDRDLATDLAVLPDLRQVPDIARLSRDLGRSPGDLVGGMAALDDAVGLVRLAAEIDAVDVDGRWLLAARQANVAEVAALAREALTAAVDARPGVDARTAVEAHIEERADEVAEAVRFRREAETDPDAGLPGLSVAVRALRRVLR